MGYAHPDHLLADLTSEQISEWLAYDKLDPINDSWRNDFGVARLSSLILNIVNTLYQDPKKPKIEAVKPLDMMPIWDRETEEERRAIEERQTPEQMRDILLSIARVQNARVGRRQKKRSTPPVNYKKK